jgi:predicted anti-sigma-YlaC factor YlaD
VQDRCNVPADPESPEFGPSANGARSLPTCRDMSELVTVYLERAVTLRTRLGMWWHLVRCEACRRYYDQMRRTVRLLRSPAPARIDSHTEDTVIAAAHREQRRDS